MKTRKPQGSTHQPTPGRLTNATRFPIRPARQHFDFQTVAFASSLDDGWQLRWRHVPYRPLAMPQTFFRLSVYRLFEPQVNMSVMSGLRSSGVKCCVASHALNSSLVGGKVRCSTEIYHAPGALNRALCSRSSR